MKISDFLSPSQVMLDLRAGDKRRLLHQLSSQAAAEVGLDAGDVAKQIAKREELGSTGVGNGVALPHARLKGLKSPFGLLARLHHGIDFEAIDDEPVDIVFLLLLPDASDEAQLNALACAARALRDPVVRERVRAAADRETLFRALADSGGD
jgi:PTS system nitrogen regulatory IIA component